MSDLIIISLSSLIVFFITFLILVFCFSKIYDYIKLMRYVEKSDLYITLLEYYMQKAYDIIYKDKLLVYSMEATKVKNEDLDIYSKQFVNLLLLTIGPSLEKVYIEYYGNEETFFKNALHYFHNKYDHDEIRETSMDQLMDNDQI